MNRIRHVMIVLTVVTTASSAEAGMRPSPPGRELDLPLAGEITNPDWAEKANGDDIANDFPPLAQLMKLSGLAKMTCHVEVAGDLSQCEVVEERPLGLGFGKATLAVASKFKMKPMRLDGAPVAGGLVTIPIRWQVPPDGDDGASAQPPPVGLDGRPPRPAALDGARRLVEAMGVREGFAASVEGAMGAITSSIDEAGDEAHPAERKAAIDAIKASADGIAPRFIERQAQAYAAHLSDAELAQALAFYESAAGKALVAEQRNVVAMAQRENQDVWRVFAADARLRFCQRVSCTQPPVAVAPFKPGAQGAKPARAK